ncbi:MAG TPA: hypothetical protein PLD27_11960 [bacterium]|nr:hypothetical protein [bacterium]HOL48672.1 hypothetical protein [bacterium]HPQ19949.1 hypothetical protein [bacterium]
MLKEKFLSQKYEINFTDEDIEFFNSARENYLLDVLEKTVLLDKHLFFLTELKELNDYKDLIYECNRLTHSIKGTGYSYGFKFISEVAFCLEELLNYVLNNMNEKIEKIQSIFKACVNINDLLNDVIKNYFFKNTEYNVSDEYNQKLFKFINETDKILKEENVKKDDINKNILICGNNAFIFNNITRLFKNNRNFIFYYAPGFLETFYEIINRKIDFVFSEFYLNEFNAFAIYSTLKNTPKYSTIPFYFIVSDINALLIKNKIPKKIILFKDKDLFTNISNIIQK